MNRFWDTIIKPLFVAAKPTVIVEIGAERGDHTQLLLEYCRSSGAVLHSIDPDPKFDVFEWEHLHEGYFHFHKELSLEGLKRVELVDAVLIDGDHNWFTVYNELQLISSKAHAESRGFPLVLLHDVEWPYGRRDGYHDPDRIPPAGIQPHQRKGIALGNTELQDEAVFNDHLANAHRSGGQFNGVLTAIEDFLAEAADELMLITVPGFHGLGIIAPKEMLHANPAVLHVLRPLSKGLVPSTIVEDIESARIRQEIKAIEGKRQSELKIDLEAEIERIRHHLRDATLRENQLVKELEQTSDEAKDLEAEIERIRHHLRDATLRENQLVKELKRTKDEASEVMMANELLGKELGQLDQWLSDVDSAITLLILSKRWKAGNLLGEIWRRASFKPRVPAPSTVVNAILETYRQWKDYADPQERIKALPAKKPSEKDMRRAKMATREIGWMFSVIMPTRNRKASLARAIKSCLDQSYENWELIIIDDGSTDGTGEFIENEYGELLNSGQIRYIYQPHRGVSAARNLGIAQASGDWIAYLDSDDKWNRHFLLMMSEALAHQPDAKAAYSYMRVNDGLNQTSYVRTDRFDFNRLEKANFISLIAYCHHRILIDEIGAFDEELTRYVDWDMILRHTRAYRPLLVPYVLADAYMGGGLGEYHCDGG